MRDVLANDVTADPFAARLLNDLDHHQYDDLSLRSVAADDSLFLRHKFHLKGKSLQWVYDVLDLTTALLARLQGGSVGDGHNAASWGDFKCAKFVANLEHLLRCLKQIALDAIAGHVFDIVEAHILHWHSYWQNVKRLGEGWFAEWPNGHRPLNTTWPWNVKPCLLVLWGVCWMFYGRSSTPTSNPQETRNRRGAAQVVELSGDFRTRHFGSLSQPTPQAPQAGTTTFSITLGSKVKRFTDNVQILLMPGQILHRTLTPITHGCIHSKQACVPAALMPLVSHTLSHDLFYD